jgi:hypothetical protein
MATTSEEVQARKEQIPQTDLQEKRDVGKAVLHECLLRWDDEHAAK